jgi:hypothetical protein
MGFESAAFAMMAASSLVEGNANKQALNSQADFSLAQGEANARLSLMRADDALKRGDESASEYQKKASLIKGTQRANLAAQGIALDEGSALAIQEQTAEVAAKDVARIKNNAWREAWGYETEAMNYRGNAKMEAIGLRGQADMSMLLGGMKAISYGVQAANKYDGSWFKNKNSDYGTISSAGKNYGKTQ